ncbi:hypothetical protein [Gynurincola endophyticus]|uniref:hypothetical protein n=1 Tax=Gynurincola endophyticus TaxID=2479004 RepID=UPI0018F44A25|nr:hypothetical protein [Gynurincola endophyticus]
MRAELQLYGKILPQNKNSKTDLYHDLILRELDCSVIEYLHTQIALQISSKELFEQTMIHQSFDTVRGIFTEGGPAFEGAGIQAKNHIQVCIRNLNCIKGFFIPRKEYRFPR